MPNGGARQASGHAETPNAETWGLGILIGILMASDGAMLALIFIELAPKAFGRTTWRGATIGTMLGAAVMLALSAALGV